MTIEELHRTVVEGFQRIDDRLAGHDEGFVGMDKRFARIDAQFTRIDAQFNRIDERFSRIDAQFSRIDVQFSRIDERFETVEARIREEGETTRRHFNVMVEKIEAAVRIVAEGHDRLRTVVDNHEARLQSVEKLL